MYGSGLVYGSGVLNRIYIQGNKRSTGKEWYIDDSLSIGSLNSADTRNAVHKNVALLLRWGRTPGIINRVKYITTDTTSSALQNATDWNDWDTLIIQWGNLTIDNDFNSGATFQDTLHKGVIVLSKDDTSDSATNGWFIYIKKEPRFIGASLFADQSIFSVHDLPAGGVAPYSTSDSDRTKNLDKQLVFYGTIFSKNTVGGAVRTNSAGNYILPWKNKTTDTTEVSLNEAVKYDLSFLRMDHKEMNPTLNGGHEEFVVILSDPRNTTEWLPGFVKMQ